MQPGDVFTVVRLCDTNTVAPDGVTTVTV
jgi:hypothetical protein